MATSLANALELTPAQVLVVGKALARLRSGEPPEQKPFRGTLDEFKAVFAGMGLG